MDQRRSIPSIGRLIQDAAFRPWLESYGRDTITNVVRGVVEEYRAGAGEREGLDEQAMVACCLDRLSIRLSSSFRRVFNLTGVVLHTNLGRAVLPEEAVSAAVDAMRWPINVEFDLAGGTRGYRDRHVEGAIARHTGAARSSIVNNNAAAVFLVLNTLAAGREVIVSRGELIEIGGAFRLPDIIVRAGCRLVEVGTTNRTHLKDYEQAIGPDTALLLKTHTSNYRITGFVSEVSTAELADLARRAGVPLVEDLGSGTLIDTSELGLPAERTVRQVVQDGADLVTFSGDKLLGGPQTGIVAGSAEMIDRLDKNPLKRALRVDKIRLAALDAVLRIYDRNDRVGKLPTLRLLARSVDEIGETARRMLGPLRRSVGRAAEVAVETCASQVGSGALPVEVIPSVAVRLTPVAGISSSVLVDVFRSLPIPVIGRVRDGSLFLDIRCLTEESTFVDQLGEASALFEAIAGRVGTEGA